jgi:hypothetical protein
MKYPDGISVGWINVKNRARIARSNGDATGKPFPNSRRLDKPLRRGRVSDSRLRPKRARPKGKMLSRCRTVPERACQAETVSLRFFCVAVAPDVVAFFWGVLVTANRVQFIMAPAVIVFWIRLGCRRFAAGSCNRSFQRRLLPTHSFARYRSLEP